MASALSEALRRKIVFENVSIGEYPKSLEAIVLPGVHSRQRRSCHIVTGFNNRRLGFLSTGFVW
jgi:hypothetical protein